MGERLTFVVAGPACIHGPVAHNGFERRCFPQMQRIGRLNIVVAVDENGRLIGSGLGMFGKDDGIAWCFVQLNVIYADGNEVIPQKFCGFFHIRLVDRAGAYAGYSEQIKQFFLESFLVLVDVILYGRHAISR
jgi:hypothetical protein